MANPSLQIGNSNWAIKEDNLLGYSTAGTRFVPQPITMTRASAGTRVNSSGLVETVELLGSNVVTNGDFATDSDWNKGTGWSISGGSATLSVQAGSSSLSSSTMTVTVGKIYKVTVNVSATSTGFRLYDALGVVSYGLSLGENVFYRTPSSSIYTVTPLGLAGSSGTISNVSVKEYAANNLARVDYDGTASSLLAEPMRTNEFTQSNQFDTTWNQSGTLTSGQDGVGGSTDAWKFENPNATSSIFQYDTTSGEQTMSAYFKKNSNYGVRFYAFGSVNTWAYFDLNNGVVVLTGNSTAKVESVGSDWFRCSMTFNQTNTRCDFYVTDNNATQVVGNITLQMAQLEQGSYPTSYIPTDGGTVTRVQDQYSKTGISNLINSEEGVLFVEMAALSNDLTNRSITISDGSTNNIIQILFSSVSNTIRFIIRVGGVGGDNLDKSTTTYTVTDFNKVALKWKQNDAQVWINGTQLGSPDTNSDVPTGLNDLSFEYLTVGNNFYGKVKQLQVYKTTDIDLAALTS